MVAGVALAITWDTLLGSPYGLDAVIVAAPVSALLIVVVSYLTTDKPKSTPARADLAFHFDIYLIPIYIKNRALV